MKRAICLQHVEFEGPAVYGEALRGLGYRVDCVLVPRDGLPEPDGVDFLLVMGGPMSVNDADRWITRETVFVRRVIEEGRAPVLGICLGSQFIAKALGGRVAPGPAPEIGLAEVRLTEQARTDRCFADLPDPLEVVEWHGEGIEPPEGAVVLAASAAFPVLAFRWGDRAYGLLFHLELDEGAISALCRNCAQDVRRAGLTEREVLGGLRGRYGAIQSSACGLVERLAGIGA